MADSGKGKLLDATILYPTPNFTQDEFHKLARTNAVDPPPDSPPDPPAEERTYQRRR